jgi:hypothetical protein
MSALAPMLTCLEPVAPAGQTRVLITVYAPPDVAATLKVSVTAPAGGEVTLTCQPVVPKKRGSIWIGVPFVFAA